MRRLLRHIVHLIVVLVLAVSGMAMAHASAAALDCAPVAVDAGHHGAHGGNALEDGDVPEACCMAQCCLMIGGLYPAFAPDGPPSGMAHTLAPFAFLPIADPHERPPREGFFRL